MSPLTHYNKPLLWVAQGQIRKAGEPAGLYSRSRGGAEQQAHEQQKAQLLVSPTASWGKLSGDNSVVKMNTSKSLWGCHKYPMQYQ